MVPQTPLTLTLVFPVLLLGTGCSADYVNVRNDISSAAGEEIYEFFQIHYTEFRRADNSSFNSAAEVAAYITAQGNVTEISGASYLGTWDAATNTPTLEDHYVFGTDISFTAPKHY